MKLPKTIVETNIVTEPKDYEGFLYKFTNLDNNKIYIGVHKGEWGDGYWTSTTDEQFLELLRSDGKFKYEILEFGNYDTMTSREYDMLSSVNAKSNPLYYNKSNGSPKYKTVRRELVNEIYERIMDGEFDIGKESVDDLVDIERLQVRLEDISGHQTTIAQKVDDNLGNTDKFFTTVLEDYKKGESAVFSRLRIDGNHSVYGIKKSKFGVDINVRSIPKSVWSQLNTAEIRHLANLLNKKKEMPVEELNEKDSIKQLVDTYLDLGTPATDKSNKEILMDLGWTSKKAAAIQKKAQVKIEEELALASGKLKIDWTAAPYDSRLEAILEDARDSESMVLCESSGYFRTDRILWAVHNNREFKKSIGESPKTVLKIFMRHPDDTYYKRWMTTDQSSNYKMLSTFLEGLGVTLYFKDLPMYEENTIVA